MIRQVEAPTEVDGKLRGYQTENKTAGEGARKSCFKR